MKILYLSSEVVPYAKTGGLADVAKALPMALKQKGHEVVIMMPCYGKINGWRYFPVVAELVMQNGIPQNNISYKIREGNIDGIRVWLVDYEYYFNRNNLYGENNTAYQDNGERFAFFSAACLEAVLAMNYCPDIIHCNDWHTSLTPLILSVKYQNNEFYKNTRTVLTVHNGSFQGIYDRSQLWMIPELSHIHNDSIEHGYGNINYLKCGVFYANKINAVSPSYAEELTTFLGGHGMAQNFIDRISDLCGIVNGCDYTDWDPVNDREIPFRFSENEIHNKKLCKYLLQETTNLPVKDVPVFGMVCRLTEQKGVNLLIPILKNFLEHEVQFILVGTGDPALEQSLKPYTAEFPKRFVFRSVYDNHLAHLVEAGADFFIMPSLFEPCGLNQMYSLAYGTLPIVRAVGGLKDTVTCYDDDSDNATGFVFTEPASYELLNCLRRVLIFYLQDKAEFRRVRKNAMKIRYSWDKSASEYETMYRSALDSPQKI